MNENDNIRVKQKGFLVEGPIDPCLLTDSVEKHSVKHHIGAHAVFMGQVRNDLINGKQVVAIDYSAYEEMAEQEFRKIKEEAFQKYDLCCMHIKHSVGLVAVGKLSLYVFISSKHRKDLFLALNEVVEKIKSDVPIWGREILEDESFVWKENK